MTGTSSKTKIVSTRIPKESVLDSEDVKHIINDGVELFSLLQMTPQAQQYLDSHPKLKEAIDKW